MQIQNQLRSESRPNRLQDGTAKKLDNLLCLLMLQGYSLSKLRNHKDSNSIQKRLFDRKGIQMTEENPHTTRWDEYIKDPDKEITPFDKLLVRAAYMIQTTLQYKEVPIELDPFLYLPALDKWCEKYPKFVRILLNRAQQIDGRLKEEGTIASYDIDFMLGVFEELDVMVNGDVDNNLNLLNSCREIASNLPKV